MMQRSVLLLAIGAAWFANAAAREPTRIPAVHATALSGEKVDLPTGQQGRVVVLVVGFSQAARDEVANWGKRLAGDYGKADRVTYYELAMLGSVPRFLHGWVVGKIRDNVPDRARARFLPVFDHQDQWKAAVAFGAPNDAYVLVIDSTGAVRARVEGAASEGGYAKVKRTVEALRAR